MGCFCWGRALGWDGTWAAIRDPDLIVVRSAAGLGTGGYAPMAAVKLRGAALLEQYSCRYHLLRRSTGIVCYTHRCKGMIMNTGHQIEPLAISSSRAVGSSDATGAWDESFLRCAANRLYECDRHLIGGGKERPAAANLACHLRDVLRESGYSQTFPEVRIDVEYGREGRAPKRNQKKNESFRI